MAAGSTVDALYFAGGCGIDVPVSQATVEKTSGRSSEPARGEAGGGADERSAPDLPLLVRHCQASLLTCGGGRKQSVRRCEIGVPVRQSIELALVSWSR